MEKSALRRQMLARREALSAEAIARAGEAVLGPALAQLKTATGCVGGYMPMRGEVPSQPLLEALHAQAIPLVLPRVQERGEMVFLPWVPGNCLTHDACGILSPASGRPSTPKALLVPLLAFDVRRHRLGYGGGYYDRAIAADSPRTIGLAYAWQMVDNLPTQPHDVALDAVVTDEGSL